MFVLYSIPVEIQKFFQNVLSLLFKIKITGKEFLNLRKNGIILSNHLDIADVIIPLFYLENIFVLYNTDILKNPFFDFIFNNNLRNLYQNLNIYFFTEEEIQNKLKTMAESHKVFLFPELYPSDTGIIKTLDLKISEAIFYCFNEGIPIFPSGINGTYKLSDFNSVINLVFNKIKINYNIGQPMEFTENLDLIEFKNEIKKQLYALSLHPERRSRGRVIIRSGARDL